MSDIGDIGAAGDIGGGGTDPGMDAGDIGADGLTMPDGQQLFDRNYVTKLRDEAANYRNQLREAQEQYNRYEVLNRYDDADRQVWLELASRWEQDPYQAAEAMRQIASRVLGDAQQAQQQAPQEQPWEQDGLFDESSMESMTPEKVQQIVAAELQRQAEQQQMEQAVEGVYGELRQASIDPSSPDGFMVLWRASNQTGGDVAKAIEAHAQYKQSIINDFVAAKTGAGAAPPPPNGMQGTQRPAPATLDDAFAAGRSFLEQGRSLG